MKKDNIKDLIGLLNSDEFNNYYYVIIKFEDNYYLEIINDCIKPYTSNLFKNNTFLGVYTSYMEDLIYYEGLLIENKLHKFICFKVCK